MYPSYEKRDPRTNLSQNTTEAKKNNTKGLISTIQGQLHETKQHERSPLEDYTLSTIVLI